MKPSCDQHKKSLLKPRQVNQQAFLRSAEERANSEEFHGAAFLEGASHPAYLEAHPPWARHLVSPITQGTELRDLCATFPSLICPGREEAQADKEQNLSSWFKKNLVPCLVQAELVCVRACAAQQDPFSHLNSQLKPTLAFST